MFSRIIITALVLLLGVCFQLENMGEPRSYKSLLTPSWNDSCTKAAAPSILNSAEGAISSYGVKTVAGAVECSTEWFSPNGEALLVTFAGYPNFAENHGIFIETRSPPSRQRLELPIRLPASSWKRVEVPVTPGEVRLVLHDESAGDAWIAVRKSIYLADTHNTLRALQAKLTGPEKKHAVIWMFAASLAIFCVFVLPKLWQRSALTLLAYSAIALLVLYRGDLFFRVDDWDFAERFLQELTRVLTLPHNEHFIPLFHLVYWLESKLFGTAYGLFILCSAVIHAANALLLSRLITRWFDKREHKNAAIALSLLYLINPLHTETLQWATMQSSLLSHTAVLIGLHAAISYLQSGSPRAFCFAGLSLLTAPFFFGTGLLLGPLIFLLTILYSSSSKRTRKSLASLAIVITVLCVTTYLSFRVTSTADASKIAFSTEFFHGVLSYMFLGAFFSLPFRGLGLIQIHSFPELHQYLPEMLSSVAGATALGILLLLVLFFYYLATRHHNDARLTLFIFGLCFILTMFALPAMGRIARGAEHALVLRYNSFALAGLFLLLAPLVRDLCKFAISGRHLTKVSLLALLCVYIHGQISFGSSIKKLATEGYEARDLFERTRLWAQLPCSAANKADCVFIDTQTGPGELEPFRFEEFAGGGLAQAYRFEPTRMRVLF